MYGINNRPSTPKDVTPGKKRSAYNPKRARLASGNSLGGNGPDRFIPQTTSKKAYKASPNLKKFDLREVELLEKSPSPERLSSPDFFTNLRSTGHYEAISSSSTNSVSTPNTVTSSATSATPASVDKTSKLSFEQRRHREFIADSLGFQSPQRVFVFATPNAPYDKKATNTDDGKRNSNVKSTLFAGIIPHHQYLTVDPLITALPPSKAMVYLATSAFSKMSQSMSFVSDDEGKRPAKRIKSHIPYRVLDAPCLRNDFYSNLVSWSKATDNVMVGLGCSVYIWSDSHGAIPVLNHDYLNNKRDIVTCVSFCPQNTFFVVGTKQGRILLFDQELCLQNYKKHSSALHPLYEYQSLTLRGISCVQWYNKSSESQLIIGEECGDISYLVVRDRSRKLNPDDFRSDSGDNEPVEMLLSHLKDPQSINLVDGKSFMLECLSKFQAHAQQVCGTSKIKYQKMECFK